MIVLDDVSVRFDKPVLTDVSLRIERGELCGLLGAGGAGKSVLLKVCCGLLTPQSGSVYLGERNIHELDDAEMVVLRRQIGMAFQNTALFDFMNVRENIAFPLTQDIEISQEEANTRITNILARVSLPGIEDLSPASLSGGMKKRVSLARAMIHQPSYLFCDDPTAGLDPVTSARIFRMLDEMRQEKGATTIVASQDVEGLLRWCDSIALLEGETLVYHGPTATARRHPAVNRFLTGTSA
ncbi:MAG: ABC transporter ATP-binding protein [Bradymonadia bacterium]